MSYCHGVLLTVLKGCALAVPKKYDLFLSYNSNDHVEVQRLADRLEELGVKCFLDRWYLQPGHNWVAALEQALDQSGAIAIVFGKGELGPWQQKERDYALDRNATAGNAFPVISLLLPGSEPPGGFLKQRMWLDLRAEGGSGRLTSEKEDLQLQRLVD